MLRRAPKRKFEKEIKPKNTMWCCVWGLLPGYVVSSSSEDDEDSAEEQDLSPKEFVITGGTEAELQISHLSPNENNVFPYEYRLQLPHLGTHNVALSPDSKTIAAVSLDGSLSLLDITEGVKIPSVAHTFVTNFWSTGFGGCNDYVYAGAGNGHVYKYDTQMGKLQHTFDTYRGNTVMGLAISPDDKLVAACDYEGYFTLFDGATGQIVTQSCLRKTVRRMAFDPKQRCVFAACDDTTVKLMDIPTGRLSESLDGHDTMVMSVDVSPDGQRFASGDCDGIVKVWDTRNTKCSLTFMRASNTNLWDVAFNKGDSLVSCVGDVKGLKIFYC